MNTSTTQCTCMKHEYINYTMYMYEITCMKHEYINYTMYMYEITCMKHEYMYNVCQTESLDITII